MFSKILRGAVIAAIGVGGSVAQADPFAGSSAGLLTLTGPSESTYGTVSQLHYSDLKNGPQRDVLAGQFQGSFSPDTGDEGVNAANDFFRFFCIDLASWAYVGLPAQPYQRESIALTTVDAWQLTHLFENVYPHSGSGNFLAGASSTFGDFVEPDAIQQSAAMQLAIWEIWFDDDLSLATSTGLHLWANTNAIVNLAQGYLDDVSNVTDAVAGWKLYRFNNGTYQDYLSATYEPRTSFQNNVPLPGTLALLGIGLAGLGLARRKTAA